MSSSAHDPRDKMIMLVEDDPDHEALTIRALRRNNIVNEIVVARDGTEAIQLLLGSDDQPPNRQARLPQIVLLDLKLPRVDGLEVLRRVRAADRTRLLPVVILTSSDEEKDVVEGYRLGANSYVRKPVDFDEFIETARQLGLYWLVLNQAAPPYERGA